MDVDCKAFSTSHRGGGGGGGGYSALNPLPGSSLALRVTGISTSYCPRSLALSGPKSGYRLCSLY